MIKKVDAIYSYLCKSITGVEKGELVPLEALDMLHHQGEVGHGLETQLGLQGVQHILQQNCL